MKKYECAVIFSATLGGDVLEEGTKKYTEIITSRGGTLTELDDWGKRTLAYEINDQREGIYRFYRFTGGGDILNELNRQLRIDENVLRHMIVKDEAKPRTKRERSGTDAEPPPAEGKEVS